MILDEHPNLLPRYDRCESQVPAERLSTRHYTSEKFKQWKERRIRRNTLQRCFEAVRVLF